MKETLETQIAEIFEALTFETTRVEDSQLFQSTCLEMNITAYGGSSEASLNALIEAVADSLRSAVKRKLVLKALNGTAAN